MTVAALCIISWESTPVPLTYMHRKEPGEPSDKYNRTMEGKYLSRAENFSDKTTERIEIDDDALM